MSNFLEEMGIDKSMYEDASPETVGGEIVPVNVYDASVKDAYMYISDSGAKMVKADLDLKAEKDLFISHSFPLASGDEKGNKPLSFGIKAMKSLLFACGVEDPQLVDTEMKVGDVNRKVKYMRGLQGKKLKVGVRHEESDFSDSGVKAFVEITMNMSGENEAGEPLEEKFLEKIAKNPLKKKRGRATAAKPVSGDASTDRPSANWASN